jgi:hypothetical protein
MIEPSVLVQPSRNGGCGELQCFLFLSKIVDWLILVCGSVGCAPPASQISVGVLCRGGKPQRGRRIALKIDHITIIISYSWRARESEAVVCLFLPSLSIFIQNLASGGELGSAKVVICWRPPPLPQLCVLSFKKLGGEVDGRIEGIVAGLSRLMMDIPPQKRKRQKKKKKEGCLSAPFRSESSSPGRAISYPWRAIFRGCTMQGRKT